MNMSLLSLQKQPNTAPNLFQRGVEYGKYVLLCASVARFLADDLLLEMQGPDSPDLACIWKLLIETSVFVSKSFQESAGLWMGFSAVEVRNWLQLAGWAVGESALSSP